LFPKSRSPPRHCLPGTSPRGFLFPTSAPLAEPSTNPCIVGPPTFHLPGFSCLVFLAETNLHSLPFISAQRQHSPFICCSFFSASFLANLWMNFTIGIHRSFFPVIFLEMSLYSYSMKKILPQSLFPLLALPTVGRLDPFRHFSLPLAMKMAYCQVFPLRSYRIPLVAFVVLCPPPVRMVEDFSDFAPPFLRFFLPFVHFTGRMISSPFSMCLKASPPIPKEVPPLLQFLFSFSHFPPSTPYARAPPSPP